MHTINKYKYPTPDSYTRVNKILNMSKRKCSKSLAKNTNKFIIVPNIFYIHTHLHTIKYKYGVNFTINVKEAIKFDQYSGNTLGKD